MLKIAVNGAGGRMGRRIVALLHADANTEVAAALEAPGSPHVGKDAGELAGVGTIGVPVVTSLVDRPDAIIDFSTPGGLVSISHICSERQIPLVAATTGLTPEQKSEVLSAGQMTGLVLVPNMSLAVNLTMKLVAQAARTLKEHPDGVDVEIIDRHHRFKEDAPSGTALKFGEIIAEELGISRHQHGRHGQLGQRPRDEIGYHALRVGDNVGEHTIVFGLMGETIEITVRGHTRDSYAYGAIAAAKFLVTQGPGVYTIADVLGL